MEPRETKGYALLIGVDDYSAYDPTRSLDLPGSVNDVMRDLRLQGAALRVRRG